MGEPDKDAIRECFESLRKTIDSINSKLRESNEQIDSVLIEMLNGIRAVWGTSISK